MLLTPGTGAETPSLQQVALMRDFGVTCLVGVADYLRRLTEVACPDGILPGEDVNVRMISGHLGRESREALSAACSGAEVFAWYGVGDTGTIAREGPDHVGLCVMEDAHYTVVAEITTGEEFFAHLLPIYRALLKNQLGITVNVEFAAPGALSSLTDIDTRQKPVRLIDNRAEDSPGGGPSPLLSPGGRWRNRPRARNPL